MQGMAYLFRLINFLQKCYQITTTPTTFVGFSDFKSHNILESGLTASAISKHILKTQYRKKNVKGLFSIFYTGKLGYHPSSNREYGKTYAATEHILLFYLFVARHTIVCDPYQLRCTCYRWILHPSNIPIDALKSKFIW